MKCKICNLNETDSTSGICWKCCGNSEELKSNIPRPQYYEVGVPRQFTGESNGLWNKNKEYGYDLNSLKMEESMNYEKD